MDDAGVAGRLSDADVLRSVEHTVRNVLLPALPADEEWPRAAAVQLIGLVRHALHRGPDRAVERVGEVAAALGALASNELVAWDGDPAAASVMAAAGDALAAAVDRDDDAGRAVRDALHPLLLRQLDDELAETAPLVDAFRGRLDG